MFGRLITSWRSLLVMAFFSLVATACGAAATPAPVPTATPTPSAFPASDGSGLPDTTGAAVWEYLQGVDYQKNWELWPGKGELYEGIEPHGLLLTTYLNSSALAALNGKAGSMPDGAIIVKENYMPEGNLDATTVMFKVPQYNPENNDWFFTKIGADGAVQAEGKVPGCQACHSVKKDNDYIYTGPLN